MKKSFGLGKKSTTGGSKSSGGTTSGGKKPLKKKSSLSNILRINPLGLRPARSMRAMPEDDEIKQLSKMLGLKSNRDLSTLMGEFADDGLEDFMDLIFDESAANGELEDDGTKVSRPIFDPNKPVEPGVSLEEFMGGAPPGDDGDDDDDDDATMQDEPAKKPITISAKQQTTTTTSTTTTQPDRNPSQKGKMRTLLDENDSSSSDDDDDNNHRAVEIGMDDYNNEDDDKKKKKKSSNELDLMNNIMKTTKATQSSSTSNPNTNNKTPMIIADKYYPPHLRKKFNISFDRVAFRESFARYLAQNESFVDSQNSADQNAYRYHGVLTDVNEHKELYLDIQAKFNKISHTNIAHLFTEIIEEFILIRDTPIGLLIDLIIFAVQDFCLNQRVILTSTVQAVGVICAGFQKVFGSQFGSLMIESFIACLTQHLTTLYQEYVSKYSSNFSLSKHGVIYLAPVDIKPILNLLDVIGVMYMMSCVPHKFMLGLCDWLLNSPTLFTLPSSITSATIPSSTQDDENNTKKKKANTSTSAAASTTTTTTTTTAANEKSEKLAQDIRWTVQCTILSNILVNFGLQLRKDDMVQSKTLFQVIIDRSSGYEGNWTTQELLSTLQSVKNNKQHISGSDENNQPNNSTKATSKSSTSPTNNIDYVGLREGLYGSMNYILDNFNEDLLENSAEKKGRRDSKKQQLQKQLALLQRGADNKKTIATKHISRNLINVSYQDILRVKDTGRWWIVGAGFKQTQNIMDPTLQQTIARSMLDDSDHDSNGDDSDGDGDILVKQVNSKVLMARAETLGFRSPLELYLFSTLSTSMDYIQTYNAIISKHSNHSQSNQHSSSSIVIAPSMYGEVCGVIVKTVINNNNNNNNNAQDPSTISSSDQINLASDLLGKLLTTHPHYRFALCTVFWDVIQQIQTEFMDNKREIDSVGSQRKLDKKKMATLTLKSTQISQKTSNLAQLIAQVITQPLTVDFYVLRKMAFTPMMYVMMIQGGPMGDDDDDDGDDNDDEENDDEDKKKGKKDEKITQVNVKSTKSIFGSTPLNPNDINSMNDNTILFLHKLIESLCERLGQGMETHEAEQRLKDLIVPLQSTDLTNYLTMDKDLHKLQFATISKYDKVKRQDKVAKVNFDGKRILSCLIESLKQIVIPMITMMAMDPSTTGIHKDKAQKTQKIAELMLKLMLKDNIKRK